MAGAGEERDDAWGEKTAKMAFLVVLICTVLFAGAVFLFILTRV